MACAKGLLKQRQEEVQALTDRLAIARRTAQTQIRRLEADLKEILPVLGYDFDHEDIRDANVVALRKPGK